MEAATRQLEFVRVLGRGGFGTVYLARLHGRDHFVRPVAVKVLRDAGREPSLFARQRDEARLLGRLSHPGIVQVIDLAEVDGRPAVVMEYVEGVDLGTVARAEAAAGRPLAERAVIELVAGVAAALDAAWDSPSPVDGRPLRVIHRDIKPGNLLLTAHGAVKVLDFGIARAEVEREGTTGTAFYGTVAYMGPEFWRQEPIGPAYDLYALGVTALELATGRPPERPPAEAARYAEWLEGRLADLPDATGPLAALLRAALRFTPAHRPSAAELHEWALQAADVAPGESLARLGRRVVPALLAAAGGSTALEPLPERVSLDPGPAGDPPLPSPPAAAGSPSTADTLRLPPTPSAGPPPRPPEEVADRPRQAPPPAPPRRSRARWPLVLVAAAGGMAATVGVGRLISGRPPGETVASAPAASPAGEAPTPPEPRPEPVPAAPPAASPVTPPAAAPVPASVSRPARATATRAPAEAAPKTPSSTDLPPVAYTIASDPIGARVRVDGVDRGTTPVRDLRLPPGWYTVEVTLDDRTATQRVEVGGARSGALYTFASDRWTWIYE